MESLPLTSVDSIVMLAIALSRSSEAREILLKALPKWLSLWLLNVTIHKHPIGCSVLIDSGLANSIGRSHPISSACETMIVPRQPTTESAARS